MSEVQNPFTRSQILARLTQLRVEHRQLDQEIAAQLDDHLKERRLKKRKLAIRDEIARLELLVTPDSIA